MILLCAATLRELDACLRAAGTPFDSLPDGPRPWARRLGRHLAAVTGVGIPLTVARLMPLASEFRPERIVNVGIAGAYPGSGLAIGDLVAAESEIFGDLGMESAGPEGFLPLAGMPWCDAEYLRPLALSLEPFAGTGWLRPARGCTVNACTGREGTGLLRRARTGADFESMEGAAVALAARELGVSASEARAISNIASTRDMRAGNIASALGNLGTYMGPWLGRLG